MYRIKNYIKGFINFKHFNFDYYQTLSIIDVIIAIHLAYRI